MTLNSRRLILPVLIFGALTCLGGELPAEAKLGERLFSDQRFARNAAETPVSCLTCHALPAGASAFPVRNAVPPRSDGQTLTVRHAQILTGASESITEGWGLLHWDGEFASMEDLVQGTFTGRNFGWRPDEKAAAIRHFAAVIRGDPELLAQLRGGDPTGATATDEQVLGAAAKAVGAYLKTLRFPRDAAGWYRDSAYDAFLEANFLPRAPVPGEPLIRYSRRLHEAVAGLRAPRFIDDPSRHPGQLFRFGELELQGLRIFFRGSLGYGQNARAGNCAECHAPPHFTDFALHNTGAAQDAYDAVHGAGAFAGLPIPGLVERTQAPERWLPAAARQPKGGGVFRAIVTADHPDRADLGLWNVYANPDLSAPQRVIERKLNAEGRLTPDQVLALTLGRFKTPTLRDLGRSAPYLHDGRLATVEDVLDFYRRMSDLAREGKMRNAPPEYHSMNLQPADLAPLAAFLRALNGDAGGLPAAGPR